MGQPPQTPQTPPPAPASSSGGLQPNVAAMLAYLFWIPAILWLVIEPYNKDAFIRFHSFQALFLGLVWFVLSIVLGVIPILGWILLIFLPLIALGVHIFCAVKAYGNAKFKLPLLGDFAEKTAAGA